MDSIRYKLLIAVLFISFSPVFGQFSYSLSGVVEAPTGQNIKDAVVTLQVKDTLIGYTLSDHSGKYQFSKLPANDYELTISHPDFITLETSIQLTDNKKLTHVLSPISEIALDSVLVVADRSNIVKNDATGQTFYLSGKSRKEKSIYDALSEIPSLKINPLKREIKTINNESVTILINGMERPVSLETIDPSQIEAVEVINNPSAKYLMNGLQRVINLKMKARVQNYQIVNLYTAINPELIVNTGSGGFEMGNSKYSFFINAMGMIHHNEKGKESGYQNLGVSSKIYDNSTQFNYGYYDFTVGGDFLPNKKNYLSYSAYVNRNTEAMDYEGIGNISDQLTDIGYTSIRKYDNQTWGMGGKLFYRRTINSVSQLESSASYNLNFLDNEDCTSEKGIDYNYNCDVYNDAQQHLFNYSLEYQRTLNNKSALTIGTNTAYTTGYVEDIRKENNRFDHSQWQEYLYGMYRYNHKWLSYMASAGLDVIVNRNAGIKNNYYRLKFSGSCNFQLNNRHSILLYTNGYSIAPSISYLNPFNTSSDSMQVIKGNPYLEPAYVKQIGIQYQGTVGNWYIQPILTYITYNDIYDRVGYKVDDLYVYTYENKDKKKQLYSNMSIRYSINNAGYIGLNGGYQRVFYEDCAKGWFNANINWRIYYKKFVWSGYIYAQPYTYEQYSKRKAYIDSSTSVNWNINSNWNVGATLRYILAACRNEYWIDDPKQDYSYYVNREFPKRHNMISITVQYSWKKREKKRYNNQLQLDKSNIQLLRE